MTSIMIAKKIKERIDYLFSPKNIYKDGYDIAFIPDENTDINLKEIIDELTSISLDSKFIHNYNDKKYVIWYYNKKYFNLYYKEKQSDYPSHIQINII